MANNDANIDALTNTVLDIIEQIRDIKGLDCLGAIDGGGEVAIVVSWDPALDDAASEAECAAGSYITVLTRSGFTVTVQDPGDILDSGLWREEALIVLGLLHNITAAPPLRKRSHTGSVPLNLN